MAKTIRDVYGETLAELGMENENLVVLDADVSGSTKSSVFGKQFPQRYYNVGISEANMTAMAAGFASAGKIPFVNTFAVFLSTIGLLPARLYGSYSGLNIKLAGAYGGMSDSYDGPSHHSLEDIAVMRTLPGFKVFVPCDAAQTRWVVRNAVKDAAPMYIRLSREAFPDVYGEGESFEEGKGKIVRDGTDVTVFACGLMVAHALEAAQALADEGISVRVVDMFCIKPIDKELIERCAGETKAFVSAEEHNVLGGLGGAVAEVLSTLGKAVPMEFVGVKDCHGECGAYSELQKAYGFDAEAVKNAVKKVLGK